MRPWLRSLDARTPVYSNADSAIRFLRPGPGGGLPAKADVRSGRPNPFYREELERLRARLEGDGGVIVYFIDSPVSERFLPALPELLHDLGAAAVARGENWIALRIPIQTAAR